MSKSLTAQTTSIPESLGVDVLSVACGTLVTPDDLDSDDESDAEPDPEPTPRARVVGPPPGQFRAPERRGVDRWAGE